MNDKNIKRIAVYLSLCAGILGVVGIFIWFKLDSFLLPVAVITAIVLLLNAILRGLGRFVVKTPAKWASRLCACLLAVFTALVSVCGLVYSVQDSMFFYNADSPAARANLQDKPGYSTVEFTAKNGKTYHGMMYRPTDDIAPLVIYFGGNGECSYQRMDLLDANDRWQYYAGYYYLYVDYEGYGLNEGKTHYLNMYEEALAVYDYALTLPGVASDRIISMGYSLGTGSAVYLAANRPVKGLILAAPYYEGLDAYNSMLPIFYGPMKLLVKQKLPSYEYAPDVTCPTLVIASHGDEMVPYPSSVRLSELFSGSVEFITLESANHNSLFPIDGVYDRVQSFLSEVKK